MSVNTSDKTASFADAISDIETVSGFSIRLKISSNDLGTCHNGYSYTRTPGAPTLVLALPSTSESDGTELDFNLSGVTNDGTVNLYKSTSSSMTCSGTPWPRWIPLLD